jgi:NAD(P)-dependent dehydrogenase (short-subunit alcohol dehydrogenase family)
MATVLITGCSSGIGLLAALAFARQGDTVYATMRDPARGERLATIVEDEGLDVTIAQLDVTDDGSVRRAVGAVLEADGQIDVLVNNAGVLHLGSVELLAEDALRSTFETNWFGAIRTIRAVLPAMREQGSGTIVNVSSLAGRLPSPPMNWSYAASKAALSTLSDALAWEVGPFGIKVICIEPGLFATQIVASAGRPGDPASPYHAYYEQAMVSFFDEGIKAAADAQIVADAIVESARPGSDTPVHVLVGEDSVDFVAAYRSMSEADFKEMVRPIYGF